MVVLSAAVAVLLGTVLAVLVVAVTGQRDAAHAAFRAQEALTAGSQLEKSLLSLENGLRAYIASGRELHLQPARDALDAYEGQVAALAELVSDDPAQQRAVERLGTRIEDYVMLWARPLIALGRDRRSAAESVLTTQAGRARLDTIRADFGRLVARERAVARQREQRAEQRSNLAIGVAVGGFCLVLVVAAGLAAYLRRAVVRPVTTVAEATSRLAGGELSTRVPAHRPDEIGDLARAFNAMADSLEAGRTELAARTRQLERSNTELTRSNRELEQIASMTSHDLQAPLVTISMYTELLERHTRAGGDDPADLIDGIRGATQQARALIRDLLDYSRAGRGQLRLEQVPARTVVEGALEALAGPLDESGAEVTIGPLPEVVADPGTLSRVFQNLVGNAVKFAAAGRPPEIQVGAVRDGAGWRFWVRDNGIGMAPEHAERIFEPFQRLHGEEDYDGTGIGLAICERIVARHGGRIWVDSRPDDGSVFSFTLPARPAPVASPSSPVEAGVS